MLWADWRETCTDILTVNTHEQGKTQKPDTPKAYKHSTAKNNDRRAVSCRLKQEALTL